MRRPFGCLTPAGVIAGLLTALAVGVLVLVRGGTPFSPGPLNAQVGEALGAVRSHAELDGTCAACHPAPWSRDTLSDRCLACHQTVAAEVRDAAGLHGALLAGSETLACRPCHTEHRGPEAGLTVLDADRFPHDTVGYSLQGHPDTPCTGCHPDTVTRFQPGACADCHAGLDAEYVRAHVDAFGRECLACHDGVDRYGRAFDHGRTEFPLEGRHADAACADCHAGARSAEALRAAEAACVACHREDDAHDGRFGEACGGCHTADAWEDATFDHARTAFPLDGAHAAVACESCHARGVYAGTPVDCAACHVDPAYHAGLFGTGCAACHTADAWTPARYTEPHRFPIDHGEAGPSPCRTCHPDHLQAFTCYGCHEHNPADIERKHREEGIRDFADCMRCHPTGREEEGETEGGD